MKIRIANKKGKKKQKNEQASSLNFQPTFRYSSDGNWERINIA